MPEILQRNLTAIEQLEFKERFKKWLSYDDRLELAKTFDKHEMHVNKVLSSHRYNNEIFNAAATMVIEKKRKHEEGIKRFNETLI